MIDPRKGIPSNMKNWNKKRVLDCIRHQAEKQSRASLSKLLDISKPTVCNLVDELVEEGWLLEKESKEGNVLGGRKPFHLTFNKQYKHLIGIDIGGTYTELALLNLEGDIIAHKKFSTQEQLPQNLIKTTASYVKTLILEANLTTNHILSIGIGIPGITDSANGIVRDAPSLGWKNKNVIEEFKEYLSIPVFVENDVNLAVLGEQWKGVARGKQNVILITLGTGVGCGIILNGKLYQGSNFAAGEIGYIITDKNAVDSDDYTSFQGYGFLENQVGGPAIVNRMRKRLLDDRREKEFLSAESTFQLAIKENDPTALEVVNQAVDHLSIAIVNVVSVLNPECIVLGGGISKSAHWFLPKIEDRLQRHLPKESQVALMVTNQDNSSLIGAVAHCLNQDELLRIHSVSN
ncbi:ROK family glucokinase [Bacillus carboniphilus]|uniref:ROK family glucokinase n=1 Tax=Bacillus carboniphilus TaxID=86663 RepID=A0ABN0WKM2_9BACI